MGDHDRELALLVMTYSMLRLHVLSCFFIISASAVAEGVVDFNPYIYTGLTYDDNLFRFSSDKEANAASGYAKSDVVKKLGVGVDANLHLSRQLVTLSADLSQNRYNNNAFLDNNGKSLSLGWSWRLGSDIYGKISTSKSESISGFDNNNDRVRNARTVNNKHADINWDFLPSWTLHASHEYVDLNNDQTSYQYLNREDDIYEAGIRYSNPLGTQVGLYYRKADSDYLDRLNTLYGFYYGTARAQKQVGVTMAWLPSQKTKISGQVSKVNFKRESGLQKDFNGINQRWNFTYLLSGKSNIVLTAYNEATSVDDLFASYVEYKGFSVKPTWGATSKISITGVFSIEDREFLGNSLTGVPSRANDRTERASVSMAYKPIDKALIQIGYSNEKRDANIENNSYRFNNINFIAQYVF
jgi:exopolysaccharide biosynthesis operon protein EpsL